MGSSRPSEGPHVVSDDSGDGGGDCALSASVAGGCAASRGVLGARRGLTAALQCGGGARAWRVLGVETLAPAPQGSRLRFELSYSRSSLNFVKSLNKLFKKKQPEFSPQLEI